MTLPQVCLKKTGDLAQAASASKFCEPFLAYQIPVVKVTNIKGLRAIRRLRIPLASQRKMCADGLRAASFDSHCGSVVVRVANRRSPVQSCGCVSSHRNDGLPIRETRIAVQRRKTNPRPGLASHGGVI
jgi:hypothetical protein